MPEQYPELNRKSFDKEKYMLWTVMALFLILWLLGFSMNVGGSLIHALLVLAVIVFIVNIISGRRGTV